ncbi:cellulose synthase subunit BcsC [Rubripirellula tenax]|uniref:Cellulose synthase subunit BcsC n=1 Tax=Rubripirellula tenax TaxID=2528015 RepID=A0A5C6EBU1_9BACT|nr:tetratricopeptide repeat-containing sulfotransferase family protein [Rubripirellula tenax]TWU47253.1 cellulose synthase subunit BcsC [Rubripirellula tenax]
MLATSVIHPDHLDRLFVRACGLMDPSLSGTPADRLREARRRSRVDHTDAVANAVVAVWDLIEKRPKESLNYLLRFLGDADCIGIVLQVAGYACVLQDDLDQAALLLNRTVKLEPRAAECWTVLGRIASANRQPELAMERHQRAIAVSNATCASVLDLTHVFVRHRRLDDAIHTLRVALMRDRNNPQINRTLARLLRRRSIVLGRKNMRVAKQRIVRERLRCLQTANRAAPRSDSYIRQGRLEGQLEQFDRARQSYGHAVRLDPQSSFALTHLANANVDSGNISQAIEQFESAIDMDPHHAATHFRYTRTRKFKAEPKTSDYVTMLESRLKEPELPLRDRVHLEFALGKIFDDLGEYDRAWKHFDTANRLKPGHQRSLDSAESPKPRPASDRAPLKRIAEASISFFTPEFYRANANVGIRRDSVRPIFVVGMPRSGTTLTEQILTSHPAIAGAGELKTINNIRRTIENESNDARGIAHGPVSNYPKCLWDTDQYRIQRHANDYLDQLKTFGPNETFVTDKMPTNFMHLGLIALLFPNAIVIHCQRDPMDVLVSCYCQNLNPPFCDLESLSLYYRRYRQMMAHFEEALPIRIHNITYEETVADCERVARGMIDHCGLPWDPACIDFHENERSVHTPSKWQVRQPMYATSVQKWRRFEHHLQPILDSLHQPPLDI